MSDLSVVPTKNARFPQVYEHARSALEKCVRIDECREWASKAEAIASYAKQAEDDTLMHDAQRIKARAIRRCGELLREIPKSQGKGGGVPAHSTSHVRRREVEASASPRAIAAKSAGMSSKQTEQALRVANVPPPTFEAMVDAPKPATVTELAEKGKKPSTAHLKGRDPKDFEASTRAQGALKTFLRLTDGVTPAVTVRGALPHEYAKLRTNALEASKWLGKLLVELEKTI